jgi:cell division septation protein DedD
MFLAVVGAGAVGLWKAGYLPLEQYYDEAVQMWEKRAPGSPENIKKTSEPVKKPISKTPRRVKQVPSPNPKAEKGNQPPMKQRTSGREAASAKQSGKPMEVSLVKTAPVPGKTIWAGAGPSTERQLPVAKKESEEKFIEPKAVSPAKRLPVATSAPETAKTDRKDPAPSVIKTVKFPYTIHAGSFQSMESVKKAMAQLEQQGVSSYWTQVDLGEKGTWYRIYVGWFETEQQAERFKKEQKLSSSRVLETNYGVEIGQFSSKSQIGQKMSKLKNEGYSPYVIENAADQSRVLVGAYVSRKGAEEMAHSLQKDGVACQVVLR